MAWLHPVEHVSPDQLQAGQRALVLDAGWASLSGSLSGGVILVAFALALGAGPMVVGLLGAIPFMAQAAQLPGSVLVEKWRRRRLMGVSAIAAALVLLLALALLPFLDLDAPLAWVVAVQAAVSLLVALGSSAVNSWLHQLLPAQELGRFFSRRLFAGTTLACLGTLGAGLLVDHLPVNKLHAYALAFALSALAGFVSSWYLGRAPEPRMHDAGPAVPVLQRLRSPFKDRNFRRLLVFLGAWNLASNVAAPFLTVYLMNQLGYGLGLVTALWVTSQLANAFTLYLWGRLSDRLSNKAILAVALQAYFLCTVGLVFTDVGPSPRVQLALLFLLHVAMGAASGGIGLATGNLGLKLAPQGEGTAYLASIGLVSAVAGGTAPLAAGSLAQALQAAELSVLVRWAGSSAHGEVSVLAFAHWEFLFALSALLGLYVMHALSRVEEGRDISERQVMQEFALEALRGINQLSSVAGALGSLFPFERLSERRRFWREPRSEAKAQAAPAAALDGASEKLSLSQRR